MREMYLWSLLTLTVPVYGSFGGFWGSSGSSTGEAGAPASSSSQNRSNLPASTKMTPAEALLLQQTLLKTPINFREQSDPDLVAENLALFLQQAISTDDQLSSRYMEKVASPNPKEWETFCGSWRMKTAVFVECRVDENKTLQTHGYIDCYASMAVGSRIEKERFARYYVATKPKGKPVKSKEKKEGSAAEDAKVKEKEAKIKPKGESLTSPDGSKDRISAFSVTKQGRIREFISQLHAYAKAAKDRNCSIRKLFRSTSYHRRLFSPFHPKECCPQIKFRNAKGEEKVSYAFLLPMVKDGEGNMIDIVRNWAQSSPSLFYRLLADPQLPLPEGCLADLPIVHPESVQVDPYVVEEYVENVKVFFNQKLKQFPQQDWIEVTPSDDSNMISYRLGRDIMELLQGVSAGMPGFEFLDVSQPLPFLTMSPRQPLIPECLGLGLFSRVLHGPREGLWISIRGQNQFESHTNAIGSFITSYVGENISSTLARLTPTIKDLDQTTKEFLTFPSLQSPDRMRVKKYHISRGKKGLFVVVLWDASIDGLSEDLKGSGSAGKTGDSPLVSKRHSQEEMAPRKIAVGLYPSLNPLEQKTIPKEFYDQRTAHHSPSAKRRTSPLTTSSSDLRSSPLAKQEKLEVSVSAPALFENVPPLDDIPAHSTSPSKKAIVTEITEEYSPSTTLNPKTLEKTGKSDGSDPENSQ